LPLHPFHHVRTQHTCPLEETAIRHYLGSEGQNQSYWCLDLETSQIPNPREINFCPLQTMQSKVVCYTSTNRLISLGMELVGHVKVYV
jgi:hypothetical protein